MNDFPRNIAAKSDVGNYSYPAAASLPRMPSPSVTCILINASFTYVANGNQTGGNGLTLTYASFRVYV